MLNNEEIAKLNLKKFKDTIEDYIPQTTKNPNSENFEIDSENNEERVKNLNEVIKSIAVIFDCFVIYEFLSKEKSQKCDKEMKFLINDIKGLMMKKMAEDCKIVQQVVLEGFFKILIMQKVQKPVEILARMLVLREERRMYNEKLSKKIRKSIDDFVVQYAKISKMTAMNLFTAYLQAITFLNFAKSEDYANPWMSSKESTLAKIVLPHLKIEFNIALSGVRNS